MYVNNLLLLSISFSWRLGGCMTNLHYFYNIETKIIFLDHYSDCITPFCLNSFIGFLCFHVLQTSCPYQQRPSQFSAVLWLSTLISYCVIRYFHPFSNNVSFFFSFILFSQIRLPFFPVLLTHGTTSLNTIELSLL